MCPHISRKGTYLENLGQELRFSVSQPYLIKIIAWEHSLKTHVLRPHSYIFWLRRPIIVVRRKRKPPPMLYACHKCKISKNSQGQGLCILAHTCGSECPKRCFADIWDTPFEFLNKEHVECHTGKHLPSSELCMPFEFQCMWPADHTFRGKQRKTP